MAEGFSEQIIRSIGIAVASFAVFALPVGALAITLNGLIESKCSSSLIQTIARILSDLVVVSVLLFLLFLLWGSGNLLLQLSLGQFLLGDDEVQYRHLMILSAYGGTLFGIYAAWRGRSAHGLSWLTSLLHGARVFAETAFLAYAGLWLFKEAFGYALTHRQIENWEVMAIATLGAALIFAGSLSLMGRQTHIPPQMSANAQHISFRTKIRRHIESFRVALSTLQELGSRFLAPFRR